VEQEKAKSVRRQHCVIGSVQGEIKEYSMNRGKIEKRITEFYNKLRRVQLQLFDGNMDDITYLELEIIEAQLLNRIERLEAMLAECEEDE